MFKKEHNAKCSECGYISYTSNTGTFISHFALPNMCRGCGEHMHERHNDRPHWLHVITKLQRITPDRTANPITWLRIPRWVGIETHEMHAH